MYCVAINACKQNHDKEMLEDDISGRGLNPKEVTFEQSLSDVRN